MDTIRGKLFIEGVFHYGEISYENGIITEVKLLDENKLSEEDRSVYILPGLVDIHSHGCFSHDTCDASYEGLKEMLAFQETKGVTTYFPTTMTFNEEKLAKVCENISKVAKTDKTIKGVYLEGPFISYEKRGAQNPEYIMEPDLSMLDRLNEASGNLVRIVAIAPETRGALEVIEQGSDRYCFSVAHTTADYEVTKEAFQKGARQVTHLYNAMPPYSHRSPGVIGASMDDDNVRVELIADGIHVHPAVVRNTFRTFGADRVILISDSMEATGMPDGEYSLGGQKVFVKGKLATLKDGTIAGSASTLYDCMISAVNMGVALSEAVIAATKTPAIAAGIFDKTGSLEKGKYAEILILNENLSIKKVIK